MAIHEDKKTFKEILGDQFRNLLQCSSLDEEAIEKAYHLIKLGADPYITLWTYENYNIMSFMIKQDNIKWVIRFVQEFKFDLSCLDFQNHTALYIAIKFLAINVTKWLIENVYVTQAQFNGLSINFVALDL